jgi:hypothetical protein
MTTPSNPNSKPADAGEDCAAAVSVAGLASTVDVLQRRLDELAGIERRVEWLAHTVTGIAQHASAAKKDAPSPVAPSWLDFDADPGPGETPTDAEDILGLLTGWVTAVYLRYSDARLPDCWLWHPDVVEELLWLHAAWLAAYHPDAPANAVGDWHDRQRPGVLARVKTYAGMCSLEAHLPGAERHTPAPVAPTTDAVPVIAAWWAGHRDEPAPAPSEQQRTAAGMARRTRGVRR